MKIKITLILVALFSSSLFSQTSNGKLNCSAEATPSDDAYLQASTLTSFNTEVLRTESENRVIYLKFKVPTITQTVKAVKLQLTVSTDAGKGNINIYRGSANNWTETNLSDANKPNESDLLASQDTFYSIGENYEWVLNGTIIQGETITLIVTQTDGNDISFSSKEGSYSPKLVLEYGDCDDPDDDEPNNLCPQLELNGVAAIEAEHFYSMERVATRKWYISNQGTTNLPEPDPDPVHFADASLGGYLEVLPDTRVTHDDPLDNGINFTNNGGELAVVNYKVKFQNTGKYFVWVRAYSSGTEDNGLHVGIDGQWPESGERMQWCEGKNNWTWASKQRTDENHCGEERGIFLEVLTPGIHTISISMREDGFEIDKLVLSKEYNKPSGNGPAEQLDNCSLSTTEQQLEDIKLFPNPAYNTLTIKGIEGKAGIYDLYGRKILDGININSAKNTVNVSVLPSGMYLLIFDKNSAAKFLKQ